MAKINSNYVTKFNLGKDDDVVFDQYSFFTIENRFCVITVHKVKINRKVRNKNLDVDNLYFCEVWLDNEYLMETSVDGYYEVVGEAFGLTMINTNNHSI